MTRCGWRSGGCTEVAEYFVTFRFDHESQQTRPMCTNCARVHDASLHEDWKTLASYSHGFIARVRFFDLQWLGDLAHIIAERQEA